MNAMRALDLGQIMEAIANASRPINVLWQTDDSIGFVARGREGRSEFHVDPSDEVMSMLKGDMALHHRTSEGEEKISPRFAPDAYVLVLERKRRSGEEDRFLWYCPACGNPLYEAIRHVADWREDPVSGVYEDFYGSEAHRTCAKCGHVALRPEA
jgi:3-hydroxyanthranilate 3,4-dioxygenase